MSTPDDAQASNPPPPTMALLHLIHGSKISQLLYVVGKG